jgi:hypothetical protein
MDKRHENIPLSVRHAGYPAGQIFVRQGAMLSSAKHLFRDHISGVCKVPAAQAFLLQGIALIAVVLSVQAITYFVPLRFNLFLLVLMQALFASGMCAIIRMAIWWRWIHFVFPIALWCMFQWQLPNEIYLIGFLVSLGLFWTTFRSQVPFYPSRPIVWRQVAELLPKDKPIRMIDIGSGLGDLVMHIADARPGSRVSGIEIAPLPFLLSKWRAWFRKSTAVFIRGNYQSLDFSEYDVIFAYLSPAAMPALWEKVHQEMKQGSMLISYEFEIPGVRPSLDIPGKGHSPNIYVWKI